MHLTRSISRASIALLLFFSFVTATLPVRSQSMSATAQIADYAKGLETIEAKTEARRKELGIPGMSLVIVKDDKIIFVKGFGYKDFENKRRRHARHRVRYRVRDQGLHRTDRADGPGRGQALAHGLA